ncbi:MAG: hypothetical protein R3F48_14850 [Candidatus Zixiibacteriota bacterium]
MNIRHITVALIAVLAYDILMQFIMGLTPSIYAFMDSSHLITVLSFVSGIITLLFFLFFFWEERASNAVAALVSLLVLTGIISFFLQLTQLSVYFPFEYGLSIVYTSALIKMVLLFLVMRAFKASVDASESKLHRSAGILMILFALGALGRAYDLWEMYTYVYGLGQWPTYSYWHIVMFFLFIITHGVMIWFLLDYLAYKNARRDNNASQAVGTVA